MVNENHVKRIQEALNRDWQSVGLLSSSLGINYYYLKKALRVLLDNGTAEIIETPGGTYYRLRKPEGK